ncbi:MAG: extracellular solute-binding protein [Proteobacteria bacterium]|nr:extracellular solute-binding protein [Pseudomonadota bacterium]
MKTVAPLVILVSLILGVNQASAQKTADISFFHDHPALQQVFEGLGILSEREIKIRAIPTNFKTSLYKSRLFIDLASTDRSPTIFKWWFGYRAEKLVKENLAADLSDMWNKLESNYPPGIRQALTYNGTTYGFPLHTSYWVWFYNKPLYKKYGLELPKTWEEFDKQLAFFKEKGISGIGNTVGKLRWTSFIVFQEILYRIDSDFYNRLMIGKAHWTDPQVVRAMRIWKEMLEKGYFAPMNATYDKDFPRMFRKGNLAFAPFGDWYGGILAQAGLVPGKDFDVFIPPPITDKGKGAVVLEISPLVLAKNSPHLEAGKKWIEWYSTSEKVADYIWTSIGYNTTLNVSKKLVEADSIQTGLRELIKSYPKKMVRFWEATPVGIVEFAVESFNIMLVDPHKYNEILINIEAKAKKTWPDYGVEY